MNQKSYMYSSSKAISYMSMFEYSISFFLVLFASI